MHNSKNEPENYVIDLFFFREKIEDAPIINQFVRNKMEILEQLPNKNYELSWGVSGTIQGNKMPIDVISLVATFKNIEDWKEAIIIADSILDDIFSRMGYKMDGLGEKLKNIEPIDFENLQEVWDAYKIRSKIAREGVNFEISHEEAKSALAKYEKGLKELKYI